MKIVYMQVQPSWPDEEPKEVQVTPSRFHFGGGFTDGLGTNHHMPFSSAQGVTVEKDHAIGLWAWVKREPGEA